MVKTTSLGKSVSTVLSQSKKIEASKFMIEERGVKPPGSSKFFRGKVDNASRVVSENKDTTLTLPDLCQQILVEGYVQSYIDFYYLTHRADPSEANGSTQIHTSVEDMIFIRDNLLEAEISRRQGNTTGVYNAYNKLAEHYVDKQDWKTRYTLLFVIKSKFSITITNFPSHHYHEQASFSMRNHWK